MAVRSSGGIGVKRGASLPPPHPAPTVGSQGEAIDHERGTPVHQVAVRSSGGIGLEGGASLPPPHPAVERIWHIY